MSDKRGRRVNQSRKNGIEVIAAEIRRPCNASFLTSGLAAQEENDLVEYLKSL